MFEKPEQKIDLREQILSGADIKTLLTPFLREPEIMEMDDMDACQAAYIKLLNFINAELASDTLSDEDRETFESYKAQAQNGIEENDVYNI